MATFTLHSPLLIIPTSLLLFLVVLLAYISPLTQNLLSLHRSSSTSPQLLSPAPAPAQNVPPPPLTFTTNKISTHLKKKSSGTERIEEDLARARSAIREAIRAQNSTSDEKEIYVPRGCVYRNAYAFHQSYVEMVKRFKVWVYKEGELPMAHIGPMSYIYSIGGQFMDEMESGESPFMAPHPDAAHAFFIPLSVSKIVDCFYRLEPHVFSKRLGRIFIDYISVVANKYPYWNRSAGADHFMLSCHDWAPLIVKYEPKLYQNFIRVLCNANTSEGFKPIRDVSLPEFNLKGSHNPSLGPPRLGLPPTNRTILAFFAGAAHGNIRKMLFKHWKDKDEQVQVYENLPKEKNYHKLMGQSKFCLCPSGSEVASPRVVEAMYQECVPVIISDFYTLPFSDVLDWSKFAVFIPPKRIPEIKMILEGISQRRYLILQKRVKQVARHFELNRPAKPFDVIHMVLHSLWLRRLNIKLTQNVY
ncbi:probable glycosyltransferase At5g20260 [Corylus avellana]|uniref:probable glycosyltransferase At5g20260 n=1 Tax=Corylus avellana TaxID=13451 RepID=UPI00286AFF8C|nr:probable glycosyltransferase At5g20260 [Corylus avellana]